MKLDFLKLDKVYYFLGVYSGSSVIVASGLKLEYS